MQDKELYQQILGLSSPWTVSDMQLDHDSQEIRVRAEHPREAKFCCPECSVELPCHDHAAERRWRHLDSCQFKPLLIRQDDASEVAGARREKRDNALDEKGTRLTIMFKGFAIDVLMAA